MFGLWLTVIRWLILIRTLALIQIALPESLFQRLFLLWSDYSRDIQGGPGSRGRLPGGLPGAVSGSYHAVFLWGVLWGIFRGGS